MQCRFAPGEHNVRSANCISCFADDATQQIYGEEFRRRVIQRFFITQAVTAMQVATVRQLDDEARWSIVAHAAAGFDLCYIVLQNVFTERVPSSSHSSSQAGRTNLDQLTNQIHGPGARDRIKPANGSVRLLCHSRPTGTCEVISSAFPREKDCACCFFR